MPTTLNSRLARLEAEAGARTPPQGRVFRCIVRKGFANADAAIAFAKLGMVPADGDLVIVRKLAVPYGRDASQPGFEPTASRVR